MSSQMKSDFVNCLPSMPWKLDNQCVCVCVFFFIKVYLGNENWRSQQI